MKSALALVGNGTAGTLWRSPLATHRYDRAPEVRQSERAAIRALLALRVRFGERGAHARAAHTRALERVIRPLRDAVGLTAAKRHTSNAAIVLILRETLSARRTFWAWSEERWRALLGSDSRKFTARNGGAQDVRIEVAAIAYLLGCFRDVGALGRFQREGLARRVFGAAADAAVTRVRSVVAEWGYANRLTVVSCVCEALLRNESPVLEHLNCEALERFRTISPLGKGSLYHQLGKALHAMGILERPLGLAAPHSGFKREDPSTGVSAGWRDWVERWTMASTMASRRDVRHHLYKIGRWLVASHPTVTAPGQWDRRLAAEYVSAVTRMRVGDFTIRNVALKRQGELLSPRAMACELAAARSFFYDCQEWAWIPRTFDPGRSLALPRSIKALIGPNPRVVADELWPRLLWAGLNLREEDLPRGGRDGVQGPTYPLEYVRALALVWLFAGLRSHDISRLRVGCVRWQPRTAGQQDARLCLLDIPTNKTGTAFTKPVDACVGEAIEGWQRVRPRQPQCVDHKTGERVDFLFMHRARPMRRMIINESLIPILCRKAGTPETDVRGRITSHRARATIASQLFNSRDPMSLSELQQWLGHASPASTQHYVAITPTRLARAYANAGYLERNVRAVEVLIDQDALKKGAAASGERWRYYDLGHGLCSYEFFASCAHRMACARCDFYGPKASSRAQVIEAKGSLLRVYEEIPLTDEEREAVDGDVCALQRLEQKLAGVPTPSASRNV